MSFRFIHTADIHLDSPLRSLGLRNAELAELVGNATRRAFVRIIDLCLGERVDALLLAGDLYDGAQTSMKTARFLAEQIGRLDSAGIRTFIIRGNHDAMSKITRELEFPESVKVYGGISKAVPFPDESHPFAYIHGLSFAKPHASESLLPKYRLAVEGAANIGLMHTSLGGSAGHDRYAPCTVAELKATGFDYWALGHIHARQVHEGACTVVMPGMPQGRDIGESGPKSVSLVTIADDHSVKVEERVTSVAQFERIELNATGIEDWMVLLSEVSSVLEEAREATEVEHLVARISLVGATPLSWRIRNDRDILTEEAGIRAAAIGNCWVDKLEAECRSPGEKETGTGDPVAEIRRIIDEDVTGSELFRLTAAQIVNELRGKLPAECREILGTDEASSANYLDKLIAEGTEDVLSRLRANRSQESS